MTIQKSNTLPGNTVDSAALYSFESLLLYLNLRIEPIHIYLCGNKGTGQLGSCRFVFKYKVIYVNILIMAYTLVHNT